MLAHQVIALWGQPPLPPPHPQCLGMIASISIRIWIVKPSVIGEGDSPTYWGVGGRHASPNNGPGPTQHFNLMLVVARQVPLAFPSALPLGIFGGKVSRIIRVHRVHRSFGVIEFADHSKHSFLRFVMLRTFLRELYCIGLLSLNSACIHRVCCLTAVWIFGVLGTVWDP